MDSHRRATASDRVGTPRTCRIAPALRDPFKSFRHWRSNHASTVESRAQAAQHRAGAGGANSTGRGVETGGVHCACRREDRDHITPRPREAFPEPPRTAARRHALAGWSVDARAHCPVPAGE